MVSGIMGTMQVIFYLLSCTVCLIFLSFMIKFFNKLWWTPIRIQSMMRSQGIQGPSYQFFHGNSKEVFNMTKNSSINPLELSDSQDLLYTVLPHLYSWMKLYGTNFLYWQGPRAHLVITEPEMIKEILNNRDGAFPKIEPDDYVKKLLGDGTVTARTPEKWFRLRKLSNHAFHAECLKGMIPAMIASVEMMLQRWKICGCMEIDAFQEFKVLTSEIISRTAFGSSYLEGQNIFDKLMRLGVIISRNKYKVKVPGISNLVKTEDDIESEKLEQGIQNSIISMIKKREQATITEKSDSFGNDFLGLLLKAHHDDRDAHKTKRLSVQDIIDECKTFYVAGHETTTSSLSWIVFLLAVHTDWQDKARNEILQLFDLQNPSPDGLSRMKIVSMIINEALRLYPPVAAFPREVQRQVRLGKLNLPANIEVEIPIIAIHHNPQIWGEDVHLFKPERFAEGLAKATNNNVNAYLPFALGPRSCVGSNFSIMETKIALSMILQRYHFTLSPTYAHSPVNLLTVCPKYGLQILLSSTVIGGMNI